jgi:acyl-homoserine lactone acylase PvdQ
MVASNDWVVSGRLTESGKPIFASDPHLEVNRLPAVWQELVLKAKDRYAMGATIPGLPGVLIGRTQDVAWGATDRVLLSEQSSWFEGESRDLLYRRVAETSLAAEPRAWGDGQKIMQWHLMFGGRLPKIFGFDRGPFTLNGGRATVLQGQIYRSVGRTTRFAPSFRIVSDLGTDQCLTCLAGGPSERRFSKWYCSEMDAWLTGSYKTVRP